MPVPPEAVEKTKMVMEAHVVPVTKAIGAGVKVAMGTDSGVTPHGQNLRELPLMVECGMSLAEALVATTRTAAELLGIADGTGTLEPGKVADVVVLDGDALDLHDLAGRVRRAYQGGTLVSEGRQPWRKACPRSRRAAGRRPAGRAVLSRTTSSVASRCPCSRRPRPRRAGVPCGRRASHLGEGLAHRRQRRRRPAHLRQVVEADHAHVVGTPPLCRRTAS